MRRFPEGRFGHFILMIFFGLFASGAWAQGAEKSMHHAIKASALGAEERFYSLDFLWFDNLAEGELRLDATEQPHILRAELVGRTQGIAAWLTGHRIQRYVAFMEKQPDGSLRSLSYQAQIIKRRFGKRITTGKRFLFDGENNRIVLENYAKGTFEKEKEFLLNEGPLPVDALTGFYNLRRGVYGKLVPGAHLAIPTVGSRGESKIRIEVLTRAEALHRDLFPETGLLVKVVLDPEVFDTRGGGMYIWFDPAGRPARGIVEDVIGLGDVRGHLRRKDLGP